MLFCQPSVFLTKIANIRHRFADDNDDDDNDNDNNSSSNNNNNHNKHNKHNNYGNHNDKNNHNDNDDNDKHTTTTTTTTNNNNNNDHNHSNHNDSDNDRYQHWTLQSKPRFSSQKWWFAENGGLPRAMFQTPCYPQKQTPVLWVPRHWRLDSKSAFSRLHDSKSVPRTAFVLESNILKFWVPHHSKSLRVLHSKKMQRRVQLGATS